MECARSEKGTAKMFAEQNANVFTPNIENSDDEINRYLSNIPQNIPLIKPFTRKEKQQKNNIINSKKK